MPKISIGILRNQNQNQMKSKNVLEFSEIHSKTNDSEVFMNIREASMYTRLAVQTIYQLVSARKIPYIKKGSRLIFEKNSLVQWLNSSTKTTIANWK